MRSPELEHYFRVKFTKPGAQALITIRAFHSPPARLLGTRIGQLSAHVR